MTYEMIRVANLFADDRILIDGQHFTLVNTPEPFTTTDEERCLSWIARRDDGGLTRFNGYPDAEVLAIPGPAYIGT